MSTIPLLPRAGQNLVHALPGRRAMGTETSKFFNPSEVIKRSFDRQSHGLATLAKVSKLAIPNPPNIIFASAMSDAAWRAHIVHKAHKSLEQAENENSISSFSILGGSNGSLSIAALMNIVQV